MFDFLRRNVESVGSVLFRGNLPPRLHEFESLKDAGVAIEPMQVSDEAEWGATMTHPQWGAAEIIAPRKMITPQRESLLFDPQVSEDDAADILACRSGLYVKMQGRKQNVLRDRKLFFRMLFALIGEDGVAAADHQSWRFWPRANLELELSHDADADIEALYTIHAVCEDDEPGAAGGDDEDGPTITWLHTHGLDGIGFFDFDILRPHGTYMLNVGDLMRVIAFAVFERKLKQGGAPVQVTDPGAPTVAVPAAEFMRSAAAQFTNLRNDPHGDHIDKRSVLCDAPKKSLFGLGKARAPEPSRWLRDPCDERCLMQFSNEASDLMAQRARGTYPLLRALHQEFADLKLPTLVKFGYVVDGGGPSDREHMWFQVHSLAGDHADATLINQPFHVERLKEGDRGQHDAELLSDWTIFTPVGPLNPRNTSAIAFLRKHRNELKQMLAEAEAEAEDAAED